MSPPTFLQLFAGEIRTTTRLPALHRQPCVHTIKRTVVSTMNVASCCPGMQRRSATRTVASTLPACSTSLCF